MAEFIDWEARAKERRIENKALKKRIKELTSHFEAHKKDHSGMRGLMKMIGRRKALLKYLQKSNEASYTKLLAELGLRK